ncbi:MAG: hypothetical protein JWM80_4263, partial [Cyanobacteria bacterium RYN_339]|nr:hypothetical protein [Cyanobacteria bacterium RYN_339]
PLRFLAPTSALGDARQLPLAGTGACCLLVDLLNANDPAKAAGQLYVGSSYPGRFGQVLRLTPAE